MLQTGDKRSEKRKYEDSLIEMIQDGEYDKIEKAITPIALTSCESNALLMGMKVLGVHNLCNL